MRAHTQLISVDCLVLVATFHVTVSVPKTIVDVVHAVTVQHFRFWFPFPSIQFPYIRMECSDMLSLKSKTEFESFELRFSGYKSFFLFTKSACHPQQIKMYTLRMESARLTAAFQDFHMKFLFAHCATTRKCFFSLSFVGIQLMFGKPNRIEKKGAINGRNESKANL